MCSLRKLQDRADAEGVHGRCSRAGRGEVREAVPRPPCDDRPATATAHGADGGFSRANLTLRVLRLDTNSGRARVRASKYGPPVSLDPLAAGEGEEPQGLSATNIPSHATSPEDRAEQSELRTTIQAGLDTLQEDQRLAVLLVDVHGLSYEEASQSMGCSLGTVKSRVSRGRSSLRDYLRRAGELLPSRFRQK